MSCARLQISLLSKLSFDPSFENVLEKIMSKKIFNNQLSYQILKSILLSKQLNIQTLAQFSVIALLQSLSNPKSFNQLSFENQKFQTTTSILAFTTSEKTFNNTKL